MAADTAETNWSGNYHYRATVLHRPRSINELQNLVARGRPIRAIGSRHTFTGIGDSNELVSLERLPRRISVDHAGWLVSVSPHVTYAELAEALNHEGVALHSLASLPHICVGGAVATATHGSGDAAGNLATAVRSLELVTGTGEILHVGADDVRLPGLIVGLGACGIVTGLTLSVEPFYEMRQRVFENVSWDRLFEHYGDITGAGDSVSIFHRFGERVEQVWIKRRADSEDDPDALAQLLDALPATDPRNPVSGADPANCTTQLGVAGPWSERLPHFRSGFTPSAGEEIQSEFFVARADAAEAVDRLRALAETIVPLLLVCELRTIAADELWLSPHHGRDSVGIHFTWRRRQSEVEQATRQVEAALARFAPRPHWGKLFTATPRELAASYPRLAAFLALRDELDPGGVFVNDWLRTRLDPSAAPSAD